MTTLRSQLPPPNSIVAFEAAARWQNFTRAARELNVTQAAVSRQIRTLEDFLGLPVFARGSGKARLTPEGRRLFEAAAIGLGHIAGAVVELRGNIRKSYLTLASTTSFAGLWLIPHITRFRARHPDIELRFVSSDSDLDLTAEGIDLAIRYGDGRWPGLSSNLLVRPEIVPVCSPDLLRSGRRLRDLRDLAQHTLLDREGAASFAVDWASWLGAVRGGGDLIRRRVLFNNYDLLVRAAVEGQGIALGWKPLVNELLRQKALVCPIRLAMKPRESYFLVTPKAARPHPRRDIFCDWIRQEVARS